MTTTPTTPTPPAGTLPRMPGGRPPIGPVQLIRFPPADAEQVAELAEQEGVSLAAMYRTLVHEALTAREAAAQAAPKPKTRRRAKP